MTRGSKVGKDGGIDVGGVEQRKEEEEGDN